MSLLFRKITAASDVIGYEQWILVTKKDTEQYDNEVGIITQSKSDKTKVNFFRKSVHKAVEDRCGISSSDISELYYYMRELEIGESSE